MKRALHESHEMIESRQPGAAPTLSVHRDSSCEQPGQARQRHRASVVEPDLLARRLGLTFARRLQPARALLRLPAGVHRPGVQGLPVAPPPSLATTKGLAPCPSPPSCPNCSSSAAAAAAAAVAAAAAAVPSCSRCAIARCRSPPAAAEPPPPPPRACRRRVASRSPAGEAAASTTRQPPSPPPSPPTSTSPSSPAGPRRRRALPPPPFACRCLPRPRAP